MANEESELGMVAAYNVEIDGVKRTQDAIVKLSLAIKDLRTTSYSEGTTISATSASGQAGGSADILLEKFNTVMGHVQEKAIKVMDTAVKHGKEYQVFALEAAETKTGLSGQGRNPEGRNSPGRDDTGLMIDSIVTNVEVLKLPESTVITGTHGWQADTGTGKNNRPREAYFEYQEKGTSGKKQGISKAEARTRIKSTNAQHGGGIPAANSLGQAIVPVREYLKAELRNLTK